MFFSLLFRRAMMRRNQNDLYAFRVRYLIICLIMAAIFIIAASVVLGVYGSDNHIFIYLYVYGGVEILVALIIFCRLSAMKNQAQDIVIVNQNIPMQNNQGYNAYSQGYNQGPPANQSAKPSTQPLIQWSYQQYYIYHLGNLTFTWIISWYGSMSWFIFYLSMDLTCDSRSCL